MLRKAELAKELSVIVSNEIGLLDRMSKHLAERGINIEAIAGYEMEESGEAQIMMVVDNARRAGDALEQQGFGSVTEHDIIIVELDNRPGALNTITSLLAHRGINVRYIYATVSSEGSSVRVVLSTSDNERAFVTLKKSAVP